MSTYIVEVDSTYRDVNAYQTQTNFAVSFQQNLTTQPQALGVPYSFGETGSNQEAGNFFTQTSIDPDYKYTNLSVTNGYIQDIQRTGNVFYLSGIAMDTTTVPSSTGFSISYSGTTLIMGLTGINNLSPYVCSLTQKVDESYTLNWFLYAPGDVSKSGSQAACFSFPYSSRSISRVTSKGGLFWMFDFNYNAFEVNKVTVSSGANLISNLYKITNPSVNINSFSNAIFAFDPNADQYFVSNQPWGYHIVYADFKLFNNINLPNGSIGFVLDEADNIVLNTNIDPFDPYFSITPWQSIPNRITNTVAWSYFVNDQLTSYITYTGTTGSYTGAATGAGILKEFFMISSCVTNPLLTFVNTSVSTIGFFKSSVDSINDVEFMAQVAITGPYFAPMNSLSSTGARVSRQSIFTSINNKFYYVTVTGQLYLSSINTSLTYPGYIIELDPLTASFNKIGELPSIYNSCCMIGFNTGTSMFFSARTFTSNVDLYSFDVSTNTLTTVSSLVIPGTTYVSPMVYIYNFSPTQILTISPDADYVSSIDVTVRSRTLWIMMYDSVGPSFTVINSSILLYPRILQGTFIKYPTRLVFAIVYSVPTVIEFYDITNPSTPVLLSSISARVLYSMGLQIRKDSFGNDHYFIIPSPEGGGTVMYNIDDPSQPYLINNKIFANGYMGTQPVITSAWRPSFWIGGTMNPYGYMYCTQSGITSIPSINANTTALNLIKMRWCNYPCKFYSTHYNQNISYKQNLSITYSYDKITSLSFNGSTYVFVCSKNSIEIYKPSSNIVSLTFLTSLTFDTPFTQSIYNFKTFYYPVTGQIYFSICTYLECRIYTTTPLFSSLTLIGTILRQTSDIAASDMYYSKNSLSPGLYIVVTESIANFLVRKYRILENNTLSSLLVSGTFNLNNTQRQAVELFAYYSTTTNLYIVNISGANFINTFSYSAFNINVTESTTLTGFTSFGNAPFPVRQSTDIFTRRTTNNLRTFEYPNYVTAGGTLQNSLNGYVTPDTYGGFTAYTTAGYTIGNTGPNLYWNQAWTDPLSGNLYTCYNLSPTTGVNDQLAVANISLGYVVSEVNGWNNLQVPGNTLNATTYQIGTRTVYASLLKPVSTGPGGSYTGTNSIFTYDMSNVSFAASTQQVRVNSKTYTNLQVSNGGSVLHRISNLGIPEWCSVVGGDLTQESSIIAQTTSLSKNQLNSVFVSGSWNRKVELFELNSSTGTQLSNYPVNQIIDPSLTDYYNSWFAVINFNNGKWNWIQPYIGTNNNSLNRVRYSSIQNSVYYCLSFSAENLFLYPKQDSVSNPTGASMFSIDSPINFFTNPSASSSLLVNLSLDGYINWFLKLFSNVGNTSILAKHIFLDEINSTEDPIVVVSGTSNATILSGNFNNEFDIQNLYVSLNPISQNYSFVYSFSLSGAYKRSNYQLFQENNIGENLNCRVYSDINTILVINQIFTLPNTTNNLLPFNSDSTSSIPKLLVSGTSNSVVSNYIRNPLFLDTNGREYSQVYVYNCTGSASLYNSIPTNSSLFILGYEDDVILNRNFVTRYTNYTSSTQTLKVTMNQVISLNEIDRRFNFINGITGSNLFYSSNLSSSSLYDIGVYSVTGGISGNTITFSNLYTHQTNFDLTKEYYFVFPQSTGGDTGTYNSIIPITSITYDTANQTYSMTVSDINELRSPSPSGPIYGPYLNINQKNYSAFYSLQWYPGANVFAQTYLIGLYDLIIPNRPVRNSRYPGVRTIQDYPYIYLIIYNSDDNDNFDPTVVNSVYDNNVDVPRFALFQIPTTSFISRSIDSNYYSASSSATPRIRFVPGYYNLSIRITDDRGNILIFDNTPFKESDSIFEGGVVPEELLNITTRLAFRRG